MKQGTPPKRLLSISILLVLMALVSVAAATTAWMTIADRTRVRSMRMEIISDSSLRFDLDAHEVFDDYVKTLSFRDISQRILREKGFDPADNPLTPVTTDDCVHFTLEDGSAAKQEYYLEFTLHFMSTKDMVVHLTSEGEDGTLISSPNNALPDAMRLSFTAEETCIFDPGLGASSYQSGAIRVFGLPKSDAIRYDDSNTLFSLKANVDKPVVIRIWLEGTDEACTDELRDADYSIRLRFAGTDEDGNLLEDSNPNKKGKSQ